MRKVQTMFKWIAKLFKEEENNERAVDAMEMELRILDIRRRIEEQRARIGYTQTQPNLARSNEQILPKTPGVDKTRESKETELNDLKAKLLGRK